MNHSVGRERYYTGTFAVNTMQQFKLQQRCFKTYIEMHEPKVNLLR